MKNLKINVFVSAFLVIALNVYCQGQTGELDRLRNENQLLRRQLREAQQEAESQHAAVDRQMKIAQEQRTIANVALAEAERQKIIAENARNMSEIARAEAERQREERMRQQTVAEEQRIIAEEQRAVAEKARQEAQKYRKQLGLD